MSCSFILGLHPSSKEIISMCLPRADIVWNSYALAPKLVIREASSSGEANGAADMQLREKQFSVDRKMRALQQVGHDLHMQHHPILSNLSTNNPRNGDTNVTPEQPPRPLPPVKRATSAPVRSRVAFAIKGGSRPVTPSSSSSSKATPAASSSNFLETHLLNQGSKRDTHPLALIGLAGGGPSGMWIVHFDAFPLGQRDVLLQAVLVARVRR